MEDDCLLLVLGVAQGVQYGCDFLAAKIFSHSSYYIVSQVPSGTSLTGKAALILVLA